MIKSKNFVMKCLLTFTLCSASALATADASPELIQALRSAKQGTATPEQQMLLQNAVLSSRVDGRYIYGPSDAQRIVANLAPKQR